MSVTTNWKNVIDQPIPQTMRQLPVASAAGCASCTDQRGTHRYIYFIFGAASFWRYDVQTDGWQQLANPVDVITFAAGIAMVFDPSAGTAGKIWLFGPRAVTTWAYFQVYDVALNTWISRAVPAGLAAQWGTDAALVHTCSSYHANGNDDYIYLIGNSTVTWYRYSIVGNAWVASPAGFGVNLTAAPGAGCVILWAYGWNTDKLVIIRGVATSTIYIYTIGTPAIVTLTYNPSTETFTTGTCAQASTGVYIHIQKDATHRILTLDLTNSIMLVGPQFPYVTGTTHVGDGLEIIKSTEGTTPVSFLYYRMQTGQYLWRYLITWV